LLLSILHIVHSKKIGFSKTPAMVAGALKSIELPNIKQELKNIELPKLPNPLRR